MPAPFHLRIGDLRHRIILQQPSAETDDSGNPVSFTPLPARWASMRTLSGLELQRNQSISSEATVLIEMRWLDGVTTTMTVQFGPRSFQILYIDPVEGKPRYALRLFCKELQQ